MRWCGSMLWCGVCTVRCGECDHSEQYAHHTYNMLPHHRITHNDVVFLTET